MDNRREGIGFALGLFVGTLVGASVAICLAPTSGEETRGIIKDRASEYKARASELAAEYRERMADLACEFQTNTADFIERGRDYYNRTRSDIAQMQSEPDLEKVAEDISAPEHA